MIRQFHNVANCYYRFSRYCSLNVTIIFILISGAKIINNSEIRKKSNYIFSFKHKIIENFTALAQKRLALGFIHLVIFATCDTLADNRAASKSLFLRESAET